MKKKLSELTYEFLDANDVHYMKADASDSLAGLSPSRFEKIKASLLQRYGDFDVEIIGDKYGNELKYNCDAFDRDLQKFYDHKAAWCAKYGCE